MQKLPVLVVHVVFKIDGAIESRAAKEKKYSFSSVVGRMYLQWIKPHYLSCLRLLGPGDLYFEHLPHWTPHPFIAKSIWRQGLWSEMKSSVTLVIIKFLNLLSTSSITAGPLLACGFCWCRLHMLRAILSSCARICGACVYARVFLHKLVSLTDAA